MSYLRADIVRRLVRPLGISTFVLLGSSACSGPYRSALPDDVTDAVRDHAKGCDKDEEGECYELAMAYWSGEGAPRDVGAAVPILRRTCDAGIEQACTVSEEVRLGEAGGPAMADAQACDRRDAVACGVLGVRYMDGEGVSQDVDHGVELLMMACENGSPDACYESEEVRLRGQSSEDVLASARACDRGTVDACVSLGRSYLQGEGVSPSLDNAVRLLDMGCELGATDACAQLGEMFMTGNGVAVDVDRAVPLLSAACDGGESAACELSHEVALPGGAQPAVLSAARGCDRGDGEGCVELGQAYRDGTGVAADNERAADLFEIACNGGTTSGCFELATMQMEGQGVSRDAVAAARLFDSACEAGELDACYELGSLYRTGEGVPRNIELAYQYWQRACDGGSQEACDNMPGPAEASLPVSAADNLRNLARQCDRRTWVSCVELANFYMTGSGVARNYESANQLLTLACFNGLEDMCENVRFPGPCEVEEVNEDGEIIASRSYEYDTTYLVEMGQMPSEFEPFVVNEVEMPDIDPRTNVTWEQASNSNNYEASVTIQVDENTRTVNVQTSGGATATLRFDGNGRLVEINESGQASRFTYDAAGRLIRADQEIGTREILTTVSYDTTGRPTRYLSTTRGAGGTDTEEITYSYNARGELEGMVSNFTSLDSDGDELADTYRETRLLYDAAGNPMRRAVRNEDRDVLEAINLSYECFNP